MTAALCFHGRLGLLSVARGGLKCCVLPHNLACSLLWCPSSVRRFVVTYCLGRHSRWPRWTPASGDLVQISSICLAKTIPLQTSPATARLFRANKQAGENVNHHFEEVREPRLFATRFVPRLKRAPVGRE